jgi:hypothetical protein
MLKSGDPTRPAIGVSPFQYFSSNIHCYEIKAAAEREGFLGFPITFQFFPSCYRERAVTAREPR